MKQSGSKPKGRKGKIGKKKGQMLAYANEQRREKSHIRRIKRHLARYSTGGTDVVASNALVAYQNKLSAINKGRLYV